MKTGSHFLGRLLEIVSSSMKLYIATVFKIYEEITWLAMTTKITRWSRHERLGSMEAPLGLTEG